MNLKAILKLLLIKHCFWKYKMITRCSHPMTILIYLEACQ